MPKTKKGKKGTKSVANKDKSAYPDKPAPDKGVNSGTVKVSEDDQAWNNYNPSQQEIQPGQHSENQNIQDPLTFESEESK